MGVGVMSGDGGRAGVGELQAKVVVINSKSRMSEEQFLFWCLFIIKLTTYINYLMCEEKQIVNN